MAGRWDGATLYLSRDGGTSYQVLDVDLDPGTFGIALTVLPAFTTTGAFDNTNTVDVQLTQGTDAPPVSFSDADVLAGANGAIIGDEYIQYGTVVNLGSNQYRLSHLLRGRRGTDFYWGKHLVGERAVLDNGGVKRYLVPNDLLSSQILLKAVGAGQTIADVTPMTVTVFGRELLAYAPVHLTGSRDGSQNITIGWTRRARKGFAWSGTLSVPLDYTLERYWVFCLSSAATSIASISKAAQAVVDVPGNNFAVGGWSYFTDIAGMIELNGMMAQVVAIDAMNPNLVTFAVDTRTFSTYAAPPGNSWRARHVLDATSESVVYTSVAQVADFGSNQNPLQVVVVQRNDAGLGGYGLGGSI